MLVTVHEVAMASQKVPGGRGRESGLTTESFFESGLSKPESILLSELLELRFLVRGSSIGALYVQGFGRSTRQTVNRNRSVYGEGETWRVWELFVGPWQHGQLANTAKVQLLNSHVEKQSRHSLVASFRSNRIHAQC